MQNDLFREWDPDARKELVRSVNELTEIMRSADHTVIWVRQEFSPDLSDAFPEMREHGIKLTLRGTPGSHLLADLTALPSDLKLVKKRHSAFYGTDLDFELARTQPDSLIVAGINTHDCVRMTAVDAFQRDWKVVVAADCVASHDRQHHDISMRYMDNKIAQIMSNQQIRDALVPVSGRLTGTD